MSGCQEGAAGAEQARTSLLAVFRLTVQPMAQSGPFAASLIDGCSLRRLCVPLDNRHARCSPQHSTGACPVCKSLSACLFDG
jgi:hypothetical protein